QVETVSGLIPRSHATSWFVALVTERIATSSARARPARGGRSLASDSDA
ncbi:MAG: hypothetical protein ACJA1R_000396, partial [Flavobacteriales bacterium]